MLRHNVDEDAFLRAFNEAPALFFKYHEVLHAHQLALDKTLSSGSIINDEMVSLLSAMARNLGVAGLSDRQLSSRFSSSRK
jgi:hypothetical protein